MSREISILIAEDSRTQAEELQNILERHGHRVSVADDGRQALALLEKGAPTLIISDIVMPDIDGYELCRRIKSDKHLKDIPVILLTSLSDPADIIRGLECGADNFLTKPYDEQMLLSRIQYMLLNREVRKGERTQMGMEIVFGGQRFTVTPERQQILDLLISSYETAVRKNLELLETQEELRVLNESLEEKVEERTTELRSEIIERKLTESALRKSEEQFRLLVEGVADYALFMLDPEGRIASWNDGAERIKGYREEEIIGQHLSICFTPEDIAQGKPEPALKIAAAEGRFEDECWLVRKDGSRFWANMIITALRDEEGGLRGFADITRDITERRRAEEALHASEERLQQSQKMEAVGTLAGGVAHDFNNLLTAILGNTQLALRGLPPDSRLQDFLLEIEKAGNRAAALTRQLLAFSRRQRLERRPINLNDTIDDIMKMLRRVIEADVEVRIKPAPDLAAVFADPAQIEQVIMNLAVNARDAMPRGGRLTIETRNAELDETYCRKYPYVQSGKYAEIRVSDTGVGMDEETQARIFEPFFTTKEIGRGTGLGLAMVYGIVKQHDGHIHLYSEPGQGTTFKIYLPVVEQAVEEEAQAIVLPLRGGTETILVAEDEEPLRNLAKIVLEDLGYKVLLAKDGEEAVEIFAAQHEHIDMVLLDVVMPRLGGPDAYERMQALGGDLPLIFMTGYSAETVQSRFAKQNKFVEDFDAMVIQKPYNVEVLGRKVREVLDMSRKT